MLTFTPSGNGGSSGVPSTSCRAGTGSGFDWELAHDARELLRPVVQVIIAAVLGVVFFFKNIGTYIRTFFYHFFKINIIIISDIDF